MAMMVHDISKYLWLMIFLIVSSLAIGSLAIYEKRLSDEPRIYSDAALAQYLWAPPGVPTDSIDQFLRRGDPLQAVWHAWRTYHYSRDIRLASADVEKIIKRWRVAETGKLTYSFQHGGIASGWWSGMDMLMFPMLLVEIGRETDNEEYFRLARKVISVAMKSPAEGGVFWPDDGDGCWISEYAWSGITRDREYYVLNGHLFALQSLYMLAERLVDTSLKQAYECAVRGVKSRASSFLPPNGGWPSYMLTPRTINPATYVVIEIVQFDSLHALTDNPYFDLESKRRRKVMADNYPLIAVTSGQKKELFFSAIGAPHPYLLDIYRPLIRCKSERRPLEIRGAREGTFSERAFTSFSVDSFKGLSCSVHAEYRTGIEVKLFDVERLLRVNGSTLPVPLAERNREVVLDAVTDPSGSVTIDPRLQSAKGGPAYLDDEARIIIELSKTATIRTGYIAIEMQSEDSFPIGIAVHEGDRQIHRYLPPLEAGKRMLLVLSLSGFDGSDDFNYFDKMTVYVYTAGFRRKSKFIVGDMYLLKNSYEIRQLVVHNELTLLNKVD